MKNTTKSAFSKIAIALLLFEIMFQYGGLLLTEYGSDIYRIEEFSLMVSGIVSTIVILLIFGTADLNLRYKKFNPLIFLWLILMVYGVQGIGNFVTMPLIDWLSTIGYDMQYSKDVASGYGMTGFWAFFYTFAAAPVLEECFFRGLIFGYLRKYGKIFAIIITSFFFGLMHLNIVQFPTAVLIGLIFAWTRDTYGLPFSIFIHASNNILATVMNNYIEEHISVQVIYFVMIYGGMLAILVSLIFNFKQIIAAFKNESNLLGICRQWFTTIPVILVTAFFLIITVLSILI